MECSYNIIGNKFIVCDGGTGNQQMHNQYVHMYICPTLFAILYGYIANSTPASMQAHVFAEFTHIAYFLSVI